jgi:hypothetical protein
MRGLFLRATNWLEGLNAECKVLSTRPFATPPLAADPSQELQNRMDIIFRTVAKPRLTREDKDSQLSVLARIPRTRD